MVTCIMIFMDTHLSATPQKWHINEKKIINYLLTKNEVFTVKY